MVVPAGYPGPLGSMIHPNAPHRVRVRRARGGRDAGGGSAQGTETSVRPPIDIVKVEGAIDRPLLGFLGTRIDAAVGRRRGARAAARLPGTLGQDAVALADRAATCPIPVIVWVGTVPARASGAGLLPMEASSLAAVAPGSQTGPLHPVDVLHPDEEPVGLDAAIDRWLAARGRTADRTWEEHAMTAQEALDHKFAETSAPSVTELLQQIDGRSVPTSEGPVTLQTKIATTQAEIDAGEGATIRFVEPGPVARVQHAMASPSMIVFFLVFALACLAFELTQPGFGFAGFAGVGLLLLALYGLWVVPPSWAGLALLLGGVGCSSGTFVCDGWTCEPPPAWCCWWPVRSSSTAAWPTRSRSRRG